MPILKKGEDKAYQDAYRKLMDEYTRKNDSYFNIHSLRYTDASGRDVWVRDATQALALDDSSRPRHDDIEIETNNMLMRCLSRLRAIDYAVSQTENPVLDMSHPTEEGRSRRTVIRDTLRIVLIELQQGAITSEMTTERLHELETTFNTRLIEQLHEANLTEGCFDAQSAEELLFYYRALSSVLDPAMPLITLTYDAESGMLNRESQYPVTVKTQAQKDAISTLKKVEAHPKEASAHTAHSLAKQRADACFADSLADDTRMLSAQARKTHLVGVKNAFIVNSETEFNVHKFEEADGQHFRERPLEGLGDPTPLWLARTASPVFVGRGEGAAARNLQTRENLQQIYETGYAYTVDNEEVLSRHGIHLTVLNTDSKHEKQDVILSSLRDEISNNPDSPHEMSNVPTNDLGTVPLPSYWVRLNLKIRDAFHARKSREHFGWTLGQKANRLKIAVDAMFAAAQSGYLSVVNCASGQDRTGTVVEKTLQEEILEKWRVWFESVNKRAPNREEVEVQRERIQAMRARGFNAAIIATHMAPGSPGMKSNSKANNLSVDGKRTFGPRAEKEFYLSSANTNKENKVGNVSFLKSPRELARAEFDERRNRLRAALNTLDLAGGKKTKFSDGVIEAGRQLDQAFSEFRVDEHEDEEEQKHLLKRASKMRRALGEMVVGSSGQKSARDLALMSEALEYATAATEGLQEGDLQKVETAIHEMNRIEKLLPGHERIRLKLGAFAIAAAVLLVVAIMFAFPPAGAFVLGAFAAVTALTGVIGAVVQLSAAGLGLYTAKFTLANTWRMWRKGQEQGKAKVVGDFKILIEKEKKQRQKLGQFNELVEGGEDDLGGDAEDAGEKVLLLQKKQPPPPVKK
ncbi:MAG: hypothetical protein P1U32_06475 [Legionellaceae bacterium]|nr:hypothetical protein [Legionellaceae bacterium]